MDIVKNGWMLAPVVLLTACSAGATEARGGVAEALASNWERSAYPYGVGEHPSVAVTGNRAIEVHQRLLPPCPPDACVHELWYSTATATGYPTPTWSTWSSGSHYDNGVNPSIAASGDQIVEVHQGASGVGTLWYHTGHVSAEGVVTWNNSHSYDNGVNPRIALFDGQVVEVHQATTDVGALWYRTGIVTNDGYIAWSGYSQQYDNGLNPSVTMNGTSVIEVHQGQSGVGPLWYRFGTLAFGANVNWQGAQSYDNGTHPSVAYLNCGSFIEIHMAGDYNESLWVHEGTSNCGGPPSWAPSAYSHDYGLLPTIAGADIGHGGVNALEAHQGDAGIFPLQARGYFVPQTP
jgi:hypothetical protein